MRRSTWLFVSLASLVAGCGSSGSASPAGFTSNGGSSASSGNGGSSAGTSSTGGASIEGGSGGAHAGSGGTAHAGASSVGGGSSAGGHAGTASGGVANGGDGGTSSDLGGAAGDTGNAGDSGSGGDDAGGSAGATTLSGCGHAVMPGTVSETVMSSGMERAFRVHIPAGYDPTTPTEIVFVWHGYLENGAAVETVSQMTPISDQENFLVVYPEGIGASFNAGKCCGTALSSNIDDVGFFDDMLAQIESEYCVDQKRVFSSGYSNGAMMSQRLACERANVVAAIGPVAGPIDVATCSPSRPVGVVEFHGTADPVVFYGGNSPSEAQPVETTIANWETYDQCAPPPATVYMMGDATCTEEAMCAGGSAVRFCKIQDGGHQWPGGMSGGALLGKVSTDISASQTMIDFFAAHPMP